VDSDGKPRVDDNARPDVYPDGNPEFEPYEFTVPVVDPDADDEPNRLVDYDADDHGVCNLDGYAGHRADRDGDAESECISDRNIHSDGSVGADRDIDGHVDADRVALANHVADDVVHAVSDQN